MQAAAQSINRAALSFPVSFLALVGMVYAGIALGMAAATVFAVVYLSALFLVNAAASGFALNRYLALLKGEAGAGELSQIMTGMIIFVVGLIVATVVNAVAASTGSNANIGSFTGAQDINDLLPTLFYISVMTAGLTVAGFGVVRGISGGGGFKR